MAKAHYRTKSGAEVVIEGTPEEVANVLARLEPTQRPHSNETTKSAFTKKSKTKVPLRNLVDDLIDSGFFGKPKDLGAIKSVLEEQGHFYPVTSLSPLVLRMVKKKELRRIKDKKRWVYVV